jgi:hypothetical protein
VRKKLNSVENYRYSNSTMAKEFIAKPSFHHQSLKKFVNYTYIFTQMGTITNKVTNFIFFGIKTKSKNHFLSLSKSFPNCQLFPNISLKLMKITQSAACDFHRREHTKMK